MKIQKCPSIKDQSNGTKNYVLAEDAVASNDIYIKCANEGEQDYDIFKFLLIIMKKKNHYTYLTTWKS